jgi:atlastin
LSKIHVRKCKLNDELNEILIDLNLSFVQYKSVNFMENPLNKKTDWIGAPDAPLKGFSSKRGSERATNGVVMWSDVFLHEVKVGDKTEKIAIILMDTQGLFDAKTSPADNTRIFALSTLLSSIQIFNINDVIQNNQFEYLQIATDYAQVHANLSSGTAAKPFQKLLFLLRDWVYVQDYGYGTVGGDEYVQEYLTSYRYQNPGFKGNRDYMTRSFDEVSGFLLPHPGKEVTRRDYDGRNSAMKKDFKQHLMALIELILCPDNLVKKRILGKEVTGSEYGQFMSAFFEISQ